MDVVRGARIAGDLLSRNIADSRSSVHLATDPQVPGRAGNWVREFDFSVGNYAYKRRFGVTRQPLIDISAALSWRGRPYALRDRMVRAVRNYPRLDAWLKRALGKPLSREEN